MTSVNTNASATTALRTLQQTNKALDTTQNRISTGLKIGEAKDNAAYWAISTTLKADNKSLSTVKDALNLGSATVDVAYQGLNKAKEVLEEIQKKLTASTAAGVDRNVIQAELGELQKQLVSIASASTFSGENWLSVNSETVDYAEIKNVVASFTRSASNAVEIGTVDVDISKVALFDGSTVAGKNGILDGLQNLKDNSGRDLAIGGTRQTDGGNTSKLGLDVAASNAAVGGSAEAAAAGNVTAAGAATAATAVGTPAGPSSSRMSYDSVAEGGSGAGSGDTITYTLTPSTGSAVTATITRGAAAPTLLQIAAALNADTDTNALITADASSGKLVLTSKTPGSTVTHALTVTTTAGSANYTPSATATFPVAGSPTGTPAAAASIVTGSVSRTGLAAGDVVTISYKNGTSAATTVDVSIVSGDLGSDAALAAKLGGATLVGATIAQEPASTGTTLKLSGSGTGTASTVELRDIVVKSSTGVIKNVDILGGFTESKAGTALTDAVSTNWTTNFAATDKIKLSLTVDGATVTPASIAAGASASDFAIALNADATFTAKATAEIVANKLVITSKTSGATSGVTIDSVSFTDAAGAALNKTGTGFKNTVTSATAKTADFTTAVTLDETDNLYFNVQVNDATGSKLVTINKELVNKALTAAAVALDPAAAPVTDGEISTVAEYKTVMEAALAASGVTGLKVAVGTAAGETSKLVFTTDKVGAGSKVVFEKVEASSGANQMSVENIDISSEGFAKLGVSSAADIKAVVQAYISVVNTALKGVTDAAANLGAVASRIDLQNTFVDTLMDTIDKGVSNLIDADLSEESTRLQALQTKQQLGVQALSIANSGTQNILRLFQ